MNNPIKTFSEDKDEQDRDKKTPQVYFKRQIRHTMQQTKNDCGVACLIMALNYVSKNYDESSLNKVDLDQLLIDLKVKNKSLWTIDLAHICAIKAIKHSMYTVNLGVQENYVEEEFYSKDKNFDQEKRRIEEKFAKRTELGINIIKESITLERIKSEVSSQNAVCIVLIDASRLNGRNIQIEDDENVENTIDLNETKLTKCCLLNPFGSRNEEEKSEAEFDKIVESMLNKKSGNYCGHYIVLCGFDDRKQLVFYRNPSSPFNFSYTSFVYFETARKSFGTDEDILFIYC